MTTAPNGRRVYIRHHWSRGRFYALILCRARPRDRRDILERTPERATVLEAIAEAELMAHSRGWDIRSIAPLRDRAFSK